MSLAIVIMAAGNGKWLKSRRPKELHEVGGKPLLGHVIAAAGKIVAPMDIFVVVGQEAGGTEKALATAGVGFVLQAGQAGTGHAMQCARSAIAGYTDILVLPGDVPLIQPETLELVLSFHRAENAAMTLLTAVPEDPLDYGRILRKMGEPVEVEAIVEQKSLTPEQDGISEINPWIYAFRTATLLKYLDSLTAKNSRGECDLTDMVSVLVAGGERVVALQAPDAVEVLGASTIAEIVSLDRTMRAKTAVKLMALGVTIFRPETSVIDADVEVGADTVIEPFVQLLGKTRVGTDCLIRSSTVIENSTIGDGVLIRQSCIVTDSVIGNGAKIGPFAHLRPGSDIGEEAHVGNFVETKMARLGKGAKASHLTYLGDAEVGAGTNIGAGVITCNYDGVHKHMTRIGAGAFIGSDSTLVAPITIGDGAFIGAGSCITHAVPADALAVARARQITKDGWAVQKRARQNKDG